MVGSLWSVLLVTHESAISAQSRVVWIEVADDDWLPGGELPDEYLEAGTLIEEVPAYLATCIAEAANEHLLKSGSRGRWAVAIDC